LEEEMNLDNFNEESALAIANRIDAEADAPQQSVELIEKGLGLEKEKTKGVLATIFSFIKSYNQKDANMSNDKWLENEYSKPEYSANWKSPEERTKTAKGIVGAIEDYEQARLDLERHLEAGGGRESWLARKIEAGAEANGYSDATKYADEIIEGLDGANEELLNLRFNDEKNSKKEEA
jgi:hypothetical protein